MKIARVITIQKEQFYKYVNSAKNVFMVMLCGLSLCALSQKASAQKTPSTIKVPDWAFPGSATHQQVPPPPDFHRRTRTAYTPIGIFKGQSDVGAALVPGWSSYNPATKQYTIASAGYNVWYTRDEFRYLWKKMSGDVSLAANVDFPDSAGYSDRKALLIIRQSLDDDSKEAMVGLHGSGLLHLAWRPKKGQDIQEMRVDTKALSGKNNFPHIKRIGLEKHGDDFSIFLSINGEPMHQYGKPIHLHIKGPFYVGIGFCSHRPVTVDSVRISAVLLKNEAGKVR